MKLNLYSRSVLAYSCQSFWSFFVWIKIQLMKECLYVMCTCIERLLWWTYGSAIYQAYRSIAVMDLTCSLIESIRKEGWYTWTCLTTPAITLTIKNRCFEVDSLFHEEIMLFKFSIQTYSINEDKVRW